MNSEVTDHIIVGSQEMKMGGTDRNDDDKYEEKHRLFMVTAHGSNGTYMVVGTMNKKELGTTVTGYVDGDDMVASSINRKERKYSRHREERNPMIKLMMSQ